MSTKENFSFWSANSNWTTLIGLLVAPLYLKYIGIEFYCLVGFLVTMRALAIAGWAQGKLVFIASKPDETMGKAMDASRIRDLGWRDIAFLEKNGLRLVYSYSLARCSSIGDFAK
jgi:hypothetical protein